MEEIWKDIEGYEGFYQISNFGNVYSVSKKSIKIPQISKRGYHVVGLYKNNKRKTRTIHQLLGIHFIANPENKPFINHIDGDKLNNKLSNLEWCTNAENLKHAWENGLMTDIGENHHNAKLTRDNVVNIKVLINLGYKDTYIADLFNVTRGNINAIRNKKSWIHV